MAHEGTASGSGGSSGWLAMPAEADAEEATSPPPRTRRAPAEGSQTDWSMIRRAADGDRPDAADALDVLARRYWPAIYAYIRSFGRDAHEAADLTQSFVCEVLLERELLVVADPERGRFRTLLLTALKNFLRQQHRYATRQKRSDGGAPPLQLDSQTMAAALSSEASSPEQAFSCQWAATLIRQVLDRVRRECLDDGLEDHWAVFEARVARPMLLGDEPAEYEALVTRLDLDDASQAANLVITVKRRLARALMEEVRRTVESSGDVEPELADLMRILEYPS